MRWVEDMLLMHDGRAILGEWFMSVVYFNRLLARPSWWLLSTALV